MWRSSLFNSMAYLYSGGDKMIVTPQNIGLTLDRDKINFEDGNSKFAPFSREGIY